jgi:hypothetical protein
LRRQVGRVTQVRLLLSLLNLIVESFHGELLIASLGFRVMLRLLLLFLRHIKL